jgi:hypothetical protein
LSAGDLGEYQSKNTEAEEKVSEAIALLQGDEAEEDGAETEPEAEEDTTTTEADTTPA